jgi:hypothetical protein
MPVAETTSRMKRRVQIVALWVLFVITLVVGFGILGLSPILFLGWAVVGLWDEQVANLPVFWQLWPLLRIILLVFLILGALWWGMFVWIRRL